MTDQPRPGLCGNIPAAEVIAERCYGGRPISRILCPYCQRTHLHYRPAGETGPFTSHCGRGIYTIATTQTTANPGGPTERKPQ